MKFSMENYMKKLINILNNSNDIIKNVSLKTRIPNCRYFAKS